MTAASPTLTRTPAEQSVDAGDPGSAAHIVFVPEAAGVSPQALVLAARVEGFEVEALCGYRWVPQQDPKQLPVCQRCLDLYHQPGENRDDRDELPDA